MALCPERVGRGKERPHRLHDLQPGPETGSLLALAKALARGQASRPGGPDHSLCWGVWTGPC